MVELPEALTPDLGYALEMVGERYDYSGLLGMVWVMIGRMLHRKWNNPTNSRKALFCSEMVVLLLQKSDYPNAGVLEPRNTTPHDIMKFLMENNYDNA